MLRRLTLLLSLGALALPATAAAQSVQVSGQAVALQGRAFLKAELTASAGAQPVEVRARAGFVRVVDLGGDLKVDCGGQGRTRQSKNDQGQAVFLCVGAGRAQVQGSHFRIQGFALHYGLLIPDGYTGTVQGRVRPFQPGQRGQGQGQQPPQTPPAQAASNGTGSTSVDSALAAALGN